MKVTKLILASIMALSFSQIVSAQDLPNANPTATKEFIMSCTYGVLAGTLVGGAMLAFTDQPGDNLNKVARGASLGLYAGIMLGLYVVYIVPGQGEEEVDPYADPALPPVEGAQLRQHSDFIAGITPTFNESQVDGATAQFAWSFF